VPDAMRGEDVKAFVALKEGERLSAEELLDYCAQFLARYKVPRTVEFREQLPKSDTGKILKRVLRDEAGASA
jgi:long-chain acyl-CoA synthetase